MSNPDPGASAQDVKEYAAKVLADNANWARRLNQTFPQYFPDPNKGQAPKILWLGCSDSRVQESDATTALPGDNFVHRNIANQFHLDDDNALSVLAYAVEALGVRHIVVVGHEHCGGVKAALAGASVSPQPDDAKVGHQLKDEAQELDEVSISESPNRALTRWLVPLTERLKWIKPSEDEGKTLTLAVEENVKMQVENVVKLEPFVRKYAKKKPVWVHGWVYDFSTGFLRDLQLTEELGGNA